MPFLLFIFCASYVVWLTAHVTAFQSLGWFIVDKQEALFIPLWGVLASAIITILLLIIYAHFQRLFTASIAALLSATVTVLLAVTLLLAIHRWSSFLPWVPRRSIFIFGLIEIGFLAVLLGSRSPLHFSSNYRWTHLPCIFLASAGGILLLHTSHIFSLSGLILACLSFVVGLYPVVSICQNRHATHGSGLVYTFIFFLTLALVVTLLGKWSIIPFDILDKLWMPSLAQDTKSMTYLVLSTLATLGLVVFVWCRPISSNVQSTVVDWPATSLIAFGMTLLVIDHGANLAGLFLVVLASIQLVGYNIQRSAAAPKATKYIASLAVSVFLVGVCLIVLEAGLLLTKTRVDEALRSMDSSGRSDRSPTADFLVMPAEWEYRKTNIDGASNAYYWQGKLHVHNKNGMRTIGDYTLDPGVRRIVVLGDSVTYGLGIAQSETYSAVLQDLLNKQNPGEPTKVYNLGVIAMNSEQIARIAEKWVPKLKPDRIIYGLCLNDFEDWDGEPYSNNMRWSLPTIVAEPLVENTLLGELISRGYNQLLLGTGIRQDFYQDIFKNISGRADRLGRDVSKINELALEYTGKPLLVLVVAELDRSNDSRRLTMIAEQQAERGGAEIIPTTGYLEKFGDSYADLKVSPWEGHPNALANKIWAEMIFNYLHQ